MHGFILTFKMVGLWVCDNSGEEILPMIKDFSVKIFSIWFLVMTSFFFVAFFYGLTQGLDVDLLESLGNWDGKHYLAIVDQGYANWLEFAFFPLFPLLVRVFTPIFGNSILSGFIINTVSSFFGVVYLYKLLRLEFKEKIAQKTLIFFLFFPTVFFLLATYSEALFFLFVVLTFYYSRLPLFDKKVSTFRSLFYAALFCGLATATRPLGVALVFAFYYQLFIFRKQFKIWEGGILMGVGMVGILVYCGYQFIQSGSPFTFMVAQSHWYRSFGWPWEGFFWRLLSLAYNGVHLGSYAVVFEVLFGIFGVGMVLRGFRFLPLQYNIYALFSILIPLFTTSLMSFPRFLMPVFPIFITLAFIKNKYVLWVYSFTSIIILYLFVFLFVNGFWVS